MLREPLAKTTEFLPIDLVGAVEQRPEGSDVVQRELDVCLQVVESLFGSTAKLVLCPLVLKASHRGEDYAAQQEQKYQCCRKQETGRQWNDGVRFNIPRLQHVIPLPVPYPQVVYRLFSGGPLAVGQKRWKSRGRVILRPPEISRSGGHCGPGLRHGRRACKNPTTH